MGVREGELERDPMGRERRESDEAGKGEPARLELGALLDMACVDESVRSVV